MARLRARGYLELQQFWPTGESDADTANITIDLAGDPSFVLRPDGGVEVATSVFDDAYYKDTEGNLKLVLGKNRDKLRVRLQGVDAPELHYTPKVKGAKKFRQHLAESAVVALRNKLIQMAAGQKRLRADVITFVATPNDAFDMYGRYVGNVTVYADGFAVDLNHWLLEHGWAVPGLYNSMTPRELDVARALSTEAAASNSGLYKSSYYKDKLVKFDWGLLYRSPKKVQSFNIYDDAGSVMNPKFFRRQASYETKERNAPTGLTFQQSLKADKNYRGLTWQTLQQLPPADRKNPAALRKASVQLGSLIGQNGTLPKADDLVYIEGPADIVDSSGAVIDAWDVVPVGSMIKAKKVPAAKAPRKKANGKTGKSKYTKVSK